MNPLGGTMVADPAGVGFNPYGQGGGAYGAPPAAPAPAAGNPPPAYGAPQGQGGFGAPQGQGGYGAPPAHGGYGAPPAQGGFPPPAGGGFNPPPGQPAHGGGYGAPPAGQGGYGAPPQHGGYGAPSPGGYGAPTPGAGGYGSPAPAYGMPSGGAPIVASSGGARGPIGKTRNPVMVLVISMICFVYAIIQLWQMLNELKAFRGKDDINPILFFVPILGWIQLWNLPAKILEAKQMAGVPNAQVPHPILYFFLSLYLLPVDLNEIWQAAGGRPSQG